MLEYSQEHDTESWAHKVKAHKDFHLVAAEQVVLKKEEPHAKKKPSTSQYWNKRNEIFQGQVCTVFKITENLDI